MSWHYSLEKLHELLYFMLIPVLWMSNALERSFEIFPSFEDKDKEIFPLVLSS